jgi:hypothetical protein
MLLPEVKLRQFALEGKSLDAARMLEMASQKRYTLAATLIELQNARVLDDLAEMFIKRMMRTHRHGREALAMDRLKHQERTDGLIYRLHEVILAWGAEGNAEQWLAAIDAALAPDSAVLLEQCKAYAAQAATITILISGASIRGIARRCFASGGLFHFVQRHMSSPWRQHSLLSLRTRAAAPSGFPCRTRRSISIGRRTHGGVW